MSSCCFAAMQKMETKPPSSHRTLSVIIMVFEVQMLPAVSLT